MKEIAVVRAYLESRIDNLRAEQGEHNYNDKIICELEVVENMLFAALPTALPKEDETLPHMIKLLAMIKQYTQQKMMIEKRKMTKVCHSWNS